MNILVAVILGGLIALYFIWILCSGDSESHNHIWTDWKDAGIIDAYGEM